MRGDPESEQNMVGTVGTYLGTLENTGTVPTVHRRRVLLRVWGERGYKVSVPDTGDRLQRGR